MMRIEFLKFLPVVEIAKLALTCRTLNHLIDSNKNYVYTDEASNVTWMTSEKEMDDHFNLICAIHQAGKELAEVDEFAYYQNIRDAIKHNKKKIWLLEDLKWAFGDLMNEFYQGRGFCYRRVNKELGGIEQLAYTGYSGAWTDDDDYYERTVCQNTQLNRAAIYLKWVSWFHIRTILDKVDLDHLKPTYDFYMYHGGTPEGFNGVDVKIIIKYDNLDETEKFEYKFE